MPDGSTPDLADRLTDGESLGAMVDAADAAGAESATPEDLRRTADKVESKDPERAADLRRQAEEMEAPSLDAFRLDAFLDDSIRRMVARADGREKPVPLPWSNVAEALGGGLWPGLTILLGGTASGKTQFALQAALHAAGEGCPVVYIGLELGRVDLVARLVGLRASRRWSSLYLGALRGGETADGRAEDLEKHADALRGLPLYLAKGDPAGWSYMNLRPLAEAVQRKHAAELEERADSPRRPFLVVLDFLQLVGGPERELRERIGRAAYAARLVARDLDAAVLLLSSVGRDKYQTIKDASGGPDNGKVLPSDLVGLGKESGEVEYAADYVLTLVPGTFSPNGTPIEVAAAKVRAGVPKWVDGGLRFDGGRFDENKAPVQGRSAVPSGFGGE